MKIILRFLWMIISYIFVEVIIFLPIFIVGMIIFPVIDEYASKETLVSKINGNNIITFKNKILDELFGNHEDGLLPSFWVIESNGTAYSWFIRNPICNMRFWPIVSTLPQRTDYGCVGNLHEIPNDLTPGWFFCWEGLYGGLYYQKNLFKNKYLKIWIGWKVNPRDFLEINPPKDYRSFGLGTACQFKFKNRS